MRIERIEVSVYRIPTDAPEDDGTFHWESTTMVLVEAVAEDGQRGLGYSYASAAAGTLIEETLARSVLGCAVEDVGAAWEAMVRSVRNLGRPGIASHAISAVDAALWDLKARVLGVPLFQLLGPRRKAVPVYGSGGFTNYSLDRLREQFEAWIEHGISLLKMKVGKDWGTRPEEDVERVRFVRETIGPEPELFVDANGAYTVKQAIQQAERFWEYNVTYFEEPVPFDHLDQLAFIRERIPMALASGEYGYDAYDFRNVLMVGAVDILQADATRCLGVTGCLQAGQLAHSFGIPFSTHTAASLHAHIACAVPQIEHVEYFYDHTRIERMFFDGALEPRNGCLYPDPSRPGFGLELKHSKETDKWKIG
jgi:L-alanine-DL-glutamate epimerase-like enolase superfamily enzyme